MFKSRWAAWKESNLNNGGSGTAFFVCLFFSASKSVAQMPQIKETEYLNGVSNFKTKKSLTAMQT